MTSSGAIPISFRLGLFKKSYSAFHLKKFGKENCIVEKGGYPATTSVQFTPEDAPGSGRSWDCEVVLYAPTFRDNRHGRGWDIPMTWGWILTACGRELGRNA